jgi:RHS repeat-associated protein
VTDRFACDAWGVQVKRTGSSINRQWYIGQLGYYRQVDQALDYVRARWSRPGVARWLSPDPLGVVLAGGIVGARSFGNPARGAGVPRIPSSASLTAYRYVEGSPAAYFDPSGLQVLVGGVRCCDPVVGRPVPDLKPNDCEDCCSAANRDWWLRTCYGAMCFHDGRTGAWEDCPTEAGELSKCQKQVTKDDCEAAFALASSLASRCDDACHGVGIYQGCPQVGAGTMCCRNRGDQWPHPCETKCCISDDSPLHMPKDDRGINACGRYCLLRHERWHRQIDCAPRRRRPGGPPPVPPPPAPQDSWAVDYDECCAYAIQVDCILQKYERTCPSLRWTLIPHGEACLKAKKARCWQDFPPLPG